MPTTNLNSAQSLNLTTAIPPINGTIGGSTLENVYTFSLQNRSSLAVSLTNLTADVDLELIADGNNNQLVESDEVLIGSYHGNRVSESINVVLEPGTYYLGVFVPPPSSGPAPTSPYTLNIQTSRTFSQQNEPFFDSSLITLIPNPVNTLPDFNGDGKADILLDNVATQSKAIWLMNGVVPSLGGELPNVWKDGWTIEAFGDFNGDRKTDFLLKNQDLQQKALWLMDGVNLIGGGALLNVWDQEWEVEALGDFNGDGKTDLLLDNRNLTEGQKALWLMDGTTIIGGGALLDVWEQDWTVQAVGDFNGDRKADLLLDNSLLQEKAMWLMNGTNIIGGGALFNVWQDSWDVQALGDFNGDGKTDLLLENEPLREKAIWVMDGTTIIGGSGLLSIWQAGWEVEEIGDFNGDRKTDLLLENPDVLIDNNYVEQKAMWLMDGANIIGGGALADGIWDAGWTIDAIADFDGNGTTDLVLGNSDSDLQGIWQMSGLAILQSGLLPTPLNWQASFYAEPNLLPGDLAGSTTATAFHVGELFNSQGSFIDGLKADDTDWYQFTLAQADTVSLNLNLEGTLNNVAINLYNAAQEEQTLVSDSSDRFYALAAGTYFVKLSTTQGEGAYELSLEGYGNFIPNLDLNGNLAGEDNSVFLPRNITSVLLAPTTTVADTGNLVGATIFLPESLDINQESIAVNTTGTNITAAYTTNDRGGIILRLTGAASAADYQQVLRTLTYENTATTPNPVPRSIFITVEDEDFESNFASTTVSFWNTNEEPVIDLNGNASGINVTTTVAIGTPSLIAPNLVVTDSGSILERAEVMIQNPLNGSDEILAVNTTGTPIVATYSGGLLILEGSASTAVYQSVLRTLTYNNTATNLDTTNRTLIFTVYDQELISDEAIATLTLQVAQPA